MKGVFARCAAGKALFAHFRVVWYQEQDRKILSYPFQFVDVSGFLANVKETPGHILLGYFLISVADPGKPDMETFFIFGDYVKIFDPVGPAFYTVTFHQIPPAPLNYRIKKRSS